MGGGAGMARKFMRNKNDVHMSPIRDIMKAQLLKQCGIGKKKKRQIVGAEVLKSRNKI